MVNRRQNFADTLVTLLAVVFLFVVLTYVVRGDEPADPTVARVKTLEDEGKALREVYEDHLCRLHDLQTLTIYERLSCDPVGRPH